MKDKLFHHSNDFNKKDNYVKDTINSSQLFIFTNVIRCSRLPL